MRGPAVVALMVACSAEAEDDRAGPLESLSVELMAEVAPGSEEHICRFFVVPEEGFFVQSFEHELPGSASHHAIVHVTSRNESDVRGRLDQPIRNCNLVAELGATDGSFVYSAQRGSASVHYPEDAAIELEAGAVLLLEHHVVNSSADAVETLARVRFVGSRQPSPRRAAVLHFFDWAISVPPMGESSTRMRCGVPEEMAIHFGHAHTHDRGTKVLGWRIRGADRDLVLEGGGRDGTRQFEPPIALEAGDAFEFECSYANSSASAVYQGVSATDDEMCSFTAGYVTRSGRLLDPRARICAGSGSGVVGRGTLDCSGIEQCISNGSSGGVVPAALQACWLDGCERASIAFFDLVLCRQGHCADECGVAPPSLGQIATAGESIACQACLAGACAAPVQDCAAPCP